jgi:SAM-dependent methyltransferase
MTLFHRIKLDELIVCPVCHGELPLEEISRNGSGDCRSCGRTFTYNDGVYDLTPVPAPDNDVLDKWELWEKLQANGLRAYQLAPEASCAVKGRDDVIAWKRFLKIKWSSCVLDIGCGPVGTPEYLRGWRFIKAVGIDPLSPTVATPGMLFIKAIGEYLPFTDSCFDNIILATSFDHVLSPRRVLTEVKRCLQPDGALMLWMWLKVPVPIPPPRRNPISTTWSKIFPPAPPPPVSTEIPAWQELNNSLEIPPGAIDCYHFRHDDETELQQWCQELGFGESRKKTYGTNNLFLELKKIPG